MGSDNRKNKATLISRESDEMSLDFALLSEELRKRGFKVDVLCRLQEKKISLSQIGYLAHIAKQIRSINSSDVVILDTYCIPISMLPHHKGLEVIQMWHALSAVKKFGWQTVGREDGTSEKVARLMRMHRGYDHVLCSSDVTAEYFCEAFDTDRARIVKLGLPRIDYILKDDPETAKAIEDTYPQLKSDRKNILYAPTFHKGRGVDVSGLTAAVDTGRYNLIIKLHPLDTSTDTDGIESENIIFDRQYNSYDLFRVADIIISDYSSLVVEASLADKPLFLYTYDRDEYSKTTGLNMKFEDEAIGKYTFDNAADLVKALREDYDLEALRAFRDKYIDVNTDNCTGQIADYIESVLR